jgi:hypothetical protein
MLVVLGSHPRDALADIHVYRFRRDGNQPLQGCLGLIQPSDLRQRSGKPAQSHGVIRKGTESFFCDIDGSAVLSK